MTDDARAALLRRGRETWPELDLQADVFFAFLAPRLADGADPEALSAGDLYLACGCAEGNARAAAYFATYAGPDIEAVASRIDASRSDDVAQLVYRRLFLPDEGEAGKIAGYAGRGDLRKWLKVVALRVAIDLRRGDRHADPLDDALDDRAIPKDEEPEVRHLREVYGAEFKAAFAAAVAHLGGRQRNVLRYHLDGLTADQIGRIYGAHRVTVARWLRRIRETLVQRIRAELRAELSVASHDVDSIMRLVDSGVSLSIDRLLEHSKK